MTQLPHPSSGDPTNRRVVVHRDAQDLEHSSRFRDSQMGMGLARIGGGGTDHEQIERDLERMLRLSVEGVHGAAWSDLVEHLHDYAKGTVFGFIRDNLLAIRVAHSVSNDQLAAADIRLFLELTEGGHRHRREDVVRSVIVSTLEYWRRRVIPDGMWRADGGASLRTFFVQAVLMRLLRAARAELQTLRETATDRVELELTAAATEPLGATAYDRVDDADEASRTWRHVRPLLSSIESKIVELTAAGHSQQEIAKTLGLPSAKAVEMRLWRLRQRVTGQLAS